MYIINNKEFTNKKSVIYYVHELLNKYQAGSFLNKTDEQFIFELLKNHPKYYSKIGVGVKAFQIKYNKVNGKELWIIRTDETQEDFSYYKCIYNNSSMSAIKKVARREIVNFILDFKNKYFDLNKKVICPITGDKLNIHNCHVDHEDPKFDELFNQFFNKIDIENLKIIDNGSKDKFFQNRKMAEEWINFHNKNAKLRIVSITANLSILRRR